MASFPSRLERTVASALLLLSTQPSKLMIGCCECDGHETKGKRSINEEEDQRLRLTMPSTESESCISSLRTQELSSRKQQKLRIIAAAARYHEIKLKVVKKRRSKNYRSYDNRKISSSFKSLISSYKATAETTSCLSSSSSGISSARSQRKTTEAEKIQRKRRGGGGSNHMRRRAEAILKLLSGGCCFSEVNIRRVLGDRPDTSKALRMLLKQKEVKRTGTGGQKDPYIYMINPEKTREEFRDASKKSGETEVKDFMVGMGLGMLAEQVKLYLPNFLCYAWMTSLVIG